jgi:hypothetical protein
MDFLLSREYWAGIIPAPDEVMVEAGPFSAVLGPSSSTLIRMIMSENG